MRIQPLTFSPNFPYNVLTFFVLAFFYAIYFTKMLSQKKRGIRTHQIGSRKEKKLHRTEQLMSVATSGIVVVQLLSLIAGWSGVSNGVRTIGFFLALAGDLVFLAAVVGMKDSWRAGIPEKDKTVLVTGGIYSFSRNPAFVGFDLMYIGVFLLYGNVLTGLFTVFAVVMLHRQILQEEIYMEATFGEEYRNYREKVNRYLGRKKS